MDESTVKMREHMEETRADLTDKIGELELEVAETVESVKESVQSVKRAFDIRHRVQERPWAALGTATAVGFAIGYRSGGRRPEPVRGNGHRARPTIPSVPVAVEKCDVAYDAAEEPQGKDGVLRDLGEKFRPELDALKGLAIGALFGVLRDIVGQAVPEPIEGPFREVVNSVTTKLGGEPIQSPLVDRRRR